MTAPHSRIIQQMCRETLLPLGVFQKGRSRIYIDDNHAFFTVIEFQPSGFSTGTYLNVGIHPLWELPMRKHLTLISENGSRIRPFLPFETEEQFADGLAEYLEAAEEQLLTFRQFRKPSALLAYAERRAKKRLFSKPEPNRSIWETYLSLPEDELDVRIKAARSYWQEQPSMRGMNRSKLV